MAREYTQAAGRLRHRIAIQSESNVRDAMGGVTKGHSTVTTVWGSIRPISGRELVAAQQVDSRVTHEITIRYYSALDPLHRLLYDSRVFRIESVRNIDERDKKQIIRAIEDTSS